ncbi:MAG: hypothetical protein OHK0015_32370 [Chloroflexi bacterium OHK40]
MLQLTNRTHVRRALACTLLDRLAASAPTEGGRPGQVVSLEGVAHLDYLLGLLDALTVLGVVEQLDDGLAARVPTPLAGWTLRLLSDLVDTGQPLQSDWRSPGIGDARLLGRPAALLAALDERRHELLPGAAPVREVEASVALITRCEEPGALRFLLAYDETARAWQLPGGRRELHDATARDTLLRELGEELGLGPLREPDDLELQRLPSLVETRPSPTYGLRTRTRFSPFLVTLHRPIPLAERRLRWLREEELRAGRTADGLAVAAEPLLRLLDHGELRLAERLAQ